MKKCIAMGFLFLLGVFCTCCLTSASSFDRARILHGSSPEAVSVVANDAVGEEAVIAEKVTDEKITTETVEKASEEAAEPENEVMNGGTGCEPACAPACAPACEPCCEPCDPCSDSGWTSCCRPCWRHHCGWHRRHAWRRACCWNTCNPCSSYGNYNTYTSDCGCGE